MSPSGSRKVDLPWREMLQRIQAAYSPNTIRCYRYDFTVFEDWCRKEGRSALPATPETVALFVLVRGKPMFPARSVDGWLQSQESTVCSNMGALSTRRK